MKTKWVLALLKLAILIIVLVFIGRAVAGARQEFADQQFSVRNLRLPWLALASGSYLMGILPMALFWHRVLRAMGSCPDLLPTLRAHYIGQLGKYVPGKAMVFALRYGLIRRFGVDVATGALSIFAETLTMMSVGAVVAVVLLAAQFSHRADLLLLAAGMVIVAGVPTCPPVLRFVLGWLHRRRFGDQRQPVPTSQLTLRVFFPGWLAIAAGWLLLGLSMWATLRALDLPTTRDLPLSDLPRITATLAIAVVAGFLSMLPGGVGVREWALNELLAKPYGPVAAIVAPVLLRLTWLVSELVISSMLYFMRSPPQAEGSRDT